jgi:pimeloyl-ACP methyl ester carboxylesterase
MSREGRLSAALNWYRANEIHMLFGNFPRIKVPVLGIWSTGDIFLSEKQMFLSARYVDAPWSYECIEGSGHWIPLDAPKRLNSILIDYLAGKNRGLSTSSADT